MTDVPELQLGVQDHPRGLPAEWLEKRGGPRLCQSWHRRYFVVDLNFLFEYTGGNVRSDKRVVCFC